ncbi:MAG: PASTA domain-containing protein [Prevotella sp.]|nr:PASTA domain-containing protein [Prevotella sp.]MCM1074290.1 PASTA domain-containing protein [Ruminococcus sp.]
MAKYNNEDYIYTPEGEYGGKNVKQPHRSGLINKHPVITNLVIIIIVAVLGLFIAYLSLGIFTKHGDKDNVPRVVNMSYSSAVEKLYDAGFKVEIKDSVYFDDVKPGLVVDQFPAAGATVKPGRKIYLYINAVHPKEVIVDPSNGTGQPALRGLSQRQAMAQLQEIGFKNIKVEFVPGDMDRVLRVMANGKMVTKMQKVPLNAAITLVVYKPREGVAGYQSQSYYPDSSYQSVLNEIETDPDFVADDDIYFEEDIEVSDPSSATQTAPAGDD